MVLPPLLMAVALLTQLPVTRWLKTSDYNEATRKASVNYYALVGGLIAGLLCVLYLCLSPFLPQPLLAMVLLIAWVIITGALHLDGLADSIDAAAAGHSATAKILPIFKSPTVGAMAVVALVLTLLTKVVLIYTLLEQHYGLTAMATAIVVSRLCASGYMQTTPYVRTQGLGMEVQSQSRHSTVLQGLGVLFALSFLVPLWWVVVSMVLSLCWLAVWRQFWIARIGGYVGDCVGAFIEWNETLILLIFTLALSAST
ncbi:adenosylcobinamide-GDP ribazoletransferase [Teredinibacter purpureus]|uniref:adenosylcobinamide-GDP ribazoletransferase n=1 Tax=Teredinibacter purpureus TaxID=2731756 RepID=UPI0005F84961|nr:adenosylcobinamide-GDP ribazoletransferase [Teredinibacter purpureus]